MEAQGSSSARLSYEQLNKVNPEIRLLEILQTSEHNETVRCRMTKVRLASPPPYCALSYVWGDPKNRKTIIIDDIEVSVTANLANALRDFRGNIREAALHTGNKTDTPEEAGLSDMASLMTMLHLSVLPSAVETDLDDIPWNPSTEWSTNLWNQAKKIQSAYLWADAICIDQDNVAERSHQVSIMDQIYQQAHQVVAWVGPNTEETRLGLQTLQILGKGSIIKHPSYCPELDWLKDFPAVVKKPEGEGLFGNKAWSSIKAFFELPYWRRSWIIQEMVLANALVFFSGDQVIIGDCIWHTIRLTDRIASGAVETLDFLPGNLFLNIEQLDFHSANFIELLRRKRKTLRFSRWFHTTRQVQSTDPRDKVYAFLGLGIDSITPDYSKDTRTVYCEFATRWVLGSDSAEPSSQIHPSMDISWLLNYSGLGLQLPATCNLPSWVPDWCAISTDKTTSQAPFNPNPGLFLASDGLPVKPCQVGPNSELIVYGCQCDVVTEFNSRPPLYGGWESALSRCAVLLSSFPNESAELPPLGDLFKTLTMDSSLSTQERLYSPGVADRGTPTLTLETTRTMAKAFISLFLGEPGPGVLVPSLMEFWTKNNCDISLLFPDYVDRPQHQEPSTAEAFVTNQMTRLVASVLNMIQQNLSDYTLFTTAYGRIGMGPAQLDVGDEVWVLSGTNIPVLLRPQEADYSCHVGTCFVAGMMDGEVSSLLEQDLTAFSKVEIH
jgi:hypothetical protein